MYECLYSDLSGGLSPFNLELMLMLSLSRDVFFPLRARLLTFAFKQLSPFRERRREKAHARLCVCECVGIEVKEKGLIFLRYSFCIPRKSLERERRQRQKQSKARDSLKPLF